MRRRKFKWVNVEWSIYYKCDGGFAGPVAHASSDVEAKRMNDALNRAVGRDTFCIGTRRQRVFDRGRCTDEAHYRIRSVGEPA
jgi:hypothetical protein